MFLDEKKTIVKCPYCKDEIVLEDDDVLYYGFKHKHFFHKDCLIEKETSKKRGALALEDVNEFIKSIHLDTYRMKKHYIDREALYRWIHHSYRIVVIPKHFKRKMEKIFDGFYDGLTQPIPPEHILDMWRRQTQNNNLKKIKMNNIKRGLKLEGIDLVNYDLAVILNKYDSYMEWKRRIEAEKRAKRESREMLTTYVPRVRKKEPTEEEIEKQKQKEKIENIINEIYEDIDND